MLVWVVVAGVGIDLVHFWELFDLGGAVVVVVRQVLLNWLVVGDVFGGALLDVGPVAFGDTDAEELGPFVGVAGGG